MDVTTALSILGSAEQCSLLALSLFGLLTQKGDTDLARIMWVLHLGASGAAERIGEALGVEVDAG